MSANTATATITAIGSALLNAGIQPSPATETTSKPKRERFSDRRDGESFLAWQNRLSERRQADSERKRAKRHGLTELVSDTATSLLTRAASDTQDAVFSGIPLNRASSIGLAEAMSTLDAVTMAMPKRYAGRAVSVQTAEDIKAALTTRFSRGFSPAHNKIRRPQWEDASEQFYARFTRDQDTYARGEHTSQHRADPLRAVRMHDASTLRHTPALDGNRDVMGTLGEALATGGQRADAMGKVKGMSEGSARLSDLWQRVELEGIGVILVNKHTGNSVRPTDAIETPMFAGAIDPADMMAYPPIGHELSWTMTLASWRYGVLAGRTQHGIKPELASSPVRDAVTLTPQYPGTPAELTSTR